MPLPLGIGRLVSAARALTIGNSGSKAGIDDLFPAVDRAVDGDECDRDCESCTIKYPAKFAVEEGDRLYGLINGWATHVLVATGKADWPSKIADEKGSLMTAFDAAEKPSNGRLMLSASNMPTPSHSSDYSEPTSVLILPAFVMVDNLRPAAVPQLIRDFVEKAPTCNSPLDAPPIITTTTTTATTIPQPLPAPLPSAGEALLAARACPHRAVVLLCSHRTRDARCGQSAPLLRKEMQRHLTPLGLYRDLDDDRPGGVGIYFISHVGGHKYSANVMVYRRPDAFGLDTVERGSLPPGEVLLPRLPAQAKTPPQTKAQTQTQTQTQKAACATAEEQKQGQGQEEEEEGDPGAAQCIWLARVRPEHCENLVKFTILQGKVVRPEYHLRGGFDRSKGLMSW